MQKPKGTMDYYPEDMEIRNKIFDSLRKTANNYNFREIESPAFENLAFLSKKEGEEIKEQIFVLEKKGSEQFGLRFDLTVPSARMFIEKQKTIPKPAKWFMLNRMWRYERPQAGRDREFYQLSCEIFGSSKADADAEIINLAIDCLKNLGINEDDFIVKINNRKLLEGLLENFISKDKIEDLIKVIDKKAKIPEEAFDDELKKLKIKDTEVLKKILDSNDLPDNLNQKAKQGKEELDNILCLLKNRKCIRPDISIARGLAYYTGTVFEIFDKDQKFRALAGGGRYDDLIKNLGGQESFATGFGLGYSTLTLFLKEKKLLPAPKQDTDYFIAVVDDSVKQEALMLAQKLRKQYKVEIDIMSKNLGKQFQYANLVNAKKTIVIGPDELKKGIVKIKDMDSGKESEKSLREF